jgi:hypothetical protein
VKRKSCLYHLPESLPIKYAFQGKKGAWFLHVQARPLSNLSGSDLPKGVAGKFVQHMYNGSKDTVYLEPPNFRASIGETETRGGGKRRSLGRSNCLEPFRQELLSAVSLPKEKTNKRRKKLHHLECTASEIKRGCDRGNRIPGVVAKENSGFCASADEVEPREGLSSNPMVEAPSEKSSEVISVSGIIKRYFPSSNEVSSFSSPLSFDVNVTHRTFQGQKEEQLNTITDDKCSSIQVDVLPEFTVKTPPRILTPPLVAAQTPNSLKAKLERSRVGKCLVLASSNLRISGSKQKPAISLCRLRGEKMLEPNFPSMIRNLVFEMSDSDD